MQVIPDPGASMPHLKGGSAMAFTVYRAGAEIQVNTKVEGDQYIPSITTLSDGGWVVAWSGPDSDGRGI